MLCAVCDVANLWRTFRASVADPVFVCAAIGRELFLGERVVFASPQEDLWRGQTKLAYTLLMVVPPASREELHDMKDAIPRFKVRGATSTTGA